MSPSVIPAQGGEFIHRTDFLVIGSGMAGLYAAIRLAELGSVAIVTKAGLQDSNTVHAQGGIAAAVGPTDSPDFHYEDTIKAGAGLCNPEAVRVLVENGPQRVRDLAALGVLFDRTGGRFALTREAAHRSRRILHARDETGRAISEGLSSRLRDIPVGLFEQCMMTGLIIREGQCRGITAQLPDGRKARFEAGATILASGAAGQVYSVTTNPDVATGDGVAMALRAGVCAADMEFVQFHPTALHLEGAPPFLISEAMRGEGGILLDHKGLPFMHRYHTLGELAPRDVVARAVFDQIRNSGHPCVYLKPAERDRDRLRHRFPTIYETCLQYGLDIAEQPVPVAPAAHYMMGGIRTDLWGRTSMPSLFACGEVACTGVHGANRLASNSLLEAVVFAGRIADFLKNNRDPAAGWPAPPDVELWVSPSPGGTGAGSRADVKTLRLELQQTMTAEVGIIRSAESLNDARQALSGLAARAPIDDASRPSLELGNMLTVAAVIIGAALYREESRGSHYRTDFPEPRDSWRRRVVMGYRQ